MAERRRPADEETDIVVVDAPAPSATADYKSKEEELRAEETRLAGLLGLQTSGQRLSREQVLDKLELEENLPLLRQEEAALRGPMEAEQLACDIADLTSLRNSLAPGMAHAFERWASSLNIVYAETQALRAVVHNYGVELNNLPVFHRLGEAAPDADDLVKEMLKLLPAEGLLAAQVSVADLKKIFAIFTPAHHHEERHLADRVARRQARRS